MQTSKEKFEEVSERFLVGMDNVNGKTMSFEANAQYMIALAIYTIAVAIFYKDRN